MRFEQASAREEEFAVEFENFVKFGGDVRADDVLYADPGGFFLSLLFDWISWSDLAASCYSCQKWGTKCRVHINTSSSCAIARRCCLAIAESFCWTIRSRLIDSLSCTLILDCRH